MATDDEGYDDTDMTEHEFDRLIVSGVPVRVTSNTPTAAPAIPMDAGVWTLTRCSSPQARLASRQYVRDSAPTVWRQAMTLPVRIALIAIALVAVLWFLIEVGVINISG